MQGRLLAVRRTPRKFLINNRTRTSNKIPGILLKQAVHLPLSLRPRQFIPLEQRTISDGHREGIFQFFTAQLKEPPNFCEKHDFYHQRIRIGSRREEREREERKFPFRTADG